MQCTLVCIRVCTVIVPQPLSRCCCGGVLGEGRKARFCRTAADGHRSTSDSHRKRETERRQQGGGGGGERKEGEGGEKNKPREEGR